MLTISILAAVAAFVHVLFFAMESLFWMKPAVRKIFRRTEAEAQTTKLMALNQGYYNLFLAIATVAGIYLWNTGYVSQAVAILTVTLGSMVAAALVLLFSAGIAMLRGVLLQGLIPAIALALIWRPV
jgi:putative membrane protein